MKNVILVTTKYCPYCPSAKQLWSDLKKQYKFNYKEVDAMTEEGQQLVLKHRIMSVPTTVIDDKVTFIGIPDKNKAVEAVKG